jgi:hypothetical protein
MAFTERLHNASSGEPMLIKYAAWETTGLMPLACCAANQRAISSGDAGFCSQRF